MEHVQKSHDRKTVKLVSKAKSLGIEHDNQNHEEQDDIIDWEQCNFNPEQIHCLLDVNIEEIILILF